VQKKRKGLRSINNNDAKDLKRVSRMMKTRIARP